MNINFYKLWFEPTGNRTQVYRFSSRHSIHWTTASGAHPEVFRLGVQFVTKQPASNCSNLV